MAHAVTAFRTPVCQAWPGPCNPVFPFVRRTLRRALRSALGGSLQKVLPKAQQCTFRPFFLDQSASRLPRIRPSIRSPDVPTIYTPACAGAYGSKLQPIATSLSCPACCVPHIRARWELFSRYAPPVPRLQICLPSPGNVRLLCVAARRFAKRIGNLENICINSTSSYRFFFPVQEDWVHIPA